MVRKMPAIAASMAIALLLMTMICLQAVVSAFADSADDSSVGWWPEGSLSGDEALDKVLESLDSSKWYHVYAGWTTQTTTDSEGNEVSKDVWDESKLAGYKWAVVKDADDAVTLVVAADEQAIGQDGYGVIPDSEKADLKTPVEKAAYPNQWFGLSKSASSVEEIYTNIRFVYGNYNNNPVTKIVVCDGITRIGASAFEYTGNSKQYLKPTCVRIAPSVTSIGENAFKDVRYSTNANSGGYSLQLGHVYKGTDERWYALPNASLAIERGALNCGNKKPKITQPDVNPDYSETTNSGSTVYPIYVPLAGSLEGSLGKDNQSFALCDGGKNYLEGVGDGSEEMIEPWDASLTIVDPFGDPVEITKGNMTVPNDVRSLSVSISVNGADDFSVSFSSSNPEVATITDEGSGSASISLEGNTGDQTMIMAKIAGDDKHKEWIAAVTLVIGKKYHKLSATEESLVVKVGETFTFSELSERLGITSSVPDDVTLGWQLSTDPFSGQEQYFDLEGLKENVRISFKKATSAFKIVFIATNEMYETARVSIPLVVEKGYASVDPGSDLTAKRANGPVVASESMKRERVPLATAANVRVRTADESIAIVDDNNRLKAVSEGSTKLQYSWDEDENVYSSADTPGNVGGWFDGADVLSSTAPALQFGWDAATRTTMKTVTMGKEDDESWRDIYIYQVLEKPDQVDYDFTIVNRDNVEVNSLGTVEKLETSNGTGAVAKLHLNTGTEALGEYYINATSVETNEFASGTQRLIIDVKGKKRVLHFSVEGEDADRLRVEETVANESIYDYILKGTWKPGGLNFTLKASDDAGAVPATGEDLLFHVGSTYMGMSSFGEWDESLRPLMEIDVNTGEAQLKTAAGSNGVFPHAFYAHTNNPVLRPDGQVYAALVGGVMVQLDISKATTTISGPESGLRLTYGGGVQALGATTSAADDGATLSYESEDPEIATVDASTGMVTPVKAGATKITVKSTGAVGSEDAEAAFDVVVDKAEQGVSVTSDDDFSVEEGESITITPSADGADEGATFVYTSSDSTVATVDERGVVAGIAPGEATITVSASATDNFKAGTKSVVITVKPMSDAKRAQMVIDQIASLGDITLESKSAIEAAEVAYDGLTDAQKQLVANYATLVAARASYDEQAANASQAEVDAAAAKGVSDQIAALGEVTLESGQAIEAAEAAYAGLTDEQKALVENHDALAGARAAYDKLVADKAAADKAAADAAAAGAVAAQIDGIGTVTLESKGAIEAAEAAYDGLTDAQKALVENHDALADARAAYDKLVADKAAADKAAADAAAAGAVAAQIDGIGTVTLESKGAIEAAEAAYAGLTDEQKQLVANHSTLVEARAAYEALLANASQAEIDTAAAKGVSDQIAALGEVTLESGQAIEAAEAAYDGLTDAQKALVENHDALAGARAAYDKLVADKAAADQEAADVAAAEAVAARIAVIGDVTLGSEKAIADAEAAYAALTDAQKAKVDNYAALTDARAAYDKLVADKAAAEAAAAEEAAANATAAAGATQKISEIGEVTLESGQAIEAAEAAYEGLTDAQKALVSNHDTLADARAAYDKLVEEKSTADTAAAGDAVAKILAIGSVTLESGDAISAARAAYDDLTDDQKTRVSEDALKVLTDAEATYAKLVADKAAADAAAAEQAEREAAEQAAREAAEREAREAAEREAAEQAAREAAENAAAAKGVSDQIAALGEVTLESSQAIEAAEAAYAGLTDAQKALVENHDTLAGARATYDKLVADKAAADAAAEQAEREAREAAEQAEREAAEQAAREAAEQAAAEQAAREAAEQAEREAAEQAAAEQAAREAAERAAAEQAASEQSAAAPEPKPLEDVPATGGSASVTIDIKSDGTATITNITTTGSTVRINTVKTADGTVVKVTAIAPEAFEGTKAKTVIVGSSVKTIGAQAFANAKNLTTVKLGKNVETIGKGTFKGCKNLESVKLGKGVKKLGKNVFKGCKKLEVVTFGKNAYTDPNAQANKATNTNADEQPVNKVKGKSVQNVGAGALANAASVSEVKLGNSVKTVGKAAFKGIAGLKTLKISTTKLTKSSCEHMLDGSSIETVRLVGMSDAQKEKVLEKYRSWFPTEVNGKTLIVR